MTKTTTSHRVAWFVYAWNADGRSEKMRRTAKMRGTWDYDVECSCGWKTNTGGAVKSWVDQLVWEHKNGYSAR